LNKIVVIDTRKQYGEKYMSHIGDFSMEYFFGRDDNRDFKTCLKSIRHIGDIPKKNIFQTTSVVFNSYMKFELPSFIVEMECIQHQILHPTPYICISPKSKLTGKHTIMYSQGTLMLLDIQLLKTL
jgi:hypothetical protein